MSAIRSQTLEQLEIEYPSEDGVPMAETPIHVLAVILLFEALQDFFGDRLDVFIAANIFWYWQEGNPKARCSPDVMVVPGVARKYRRSFMSWKENGARPTVNFEMSSENTWRSNLTDKLQLYARLGVPEYFLFDPEGIYLPSKLVGYRLQDGDYVEIMPDAEGRLYSEQLGLFLKAEGEMMRLIDARTGEPILTRTERIEKEQRRADAERQHADSERRLKEQERQRADALAAEVARLQDLLKQVQGKAEAGPASTA